jgi:hypothetical protein
MDFFDKVWGTHVGNTILVNHNLVRMMISLIHNVMLVEKWNGRVDICLKYLMGEFGGFFIPQATSWCKPFNMMQQIIRADIEFRWF